VPEVTLEPPTPADAQELGRICFDAFKNIAESHGFENDFPSPQFAAAVVGGSIASEDTYSVCAKLDGALAGSNFLTFHDEVGGVGPVSVDPPKQGNGIGRKLMQDLLKHAREDGIERVRLVQDAFNVTSMSLYSSLGFDTKHSLGLLELKPGERPNDNIRPMEVADADRADELCRDIYKVSRRHDVPGVARFGATVLVIERGGRLRGYIAPSMIGHAVAETDDDMLALMAEAARYAAEGPLPLRMICPLTKGGLFRGALAAGHRLTKMMNLMALGPYEEPEGAWLPSVLY
jgi:GNAT superfamily N-acetyltransferase